MKTFPMFLCVADRPVVIVGGGEQAAQKCRLMLKTEAQITVAWPHLETELESLVHSGKIHWHSGPVTQVLFKDAALVFIATDCPASAAAIHALVKPSGVVVNVVDQPALCTAFTPSLVDRDPVVVAIGTEGTAPVLARKIKSQIEIMLEPQVGRLAALAGQLRAAVTRSVPVENRRAFWRWVFEDAPRRLFAQGAECKAVEVLNSAVVSGGALDQDERGTLCLIGVDLGASDLLTLRALKRLQEADVIIYDRAVDAAALELARRDAERICVGKQVGGNQWSQEKINKIIVSAAWKGKSVVRLKTGNSVILGNIEAELFAIHRANIPVEIVPSVSTASTNTVVLDWPRTERDMTYCDVLLANTCQKKDLLRSAPEISLP